MQMARDDELALLNELMSENLAAFSGGQYDDMLGYRVGEERGGPPRARMGERPRGPAGPQRVQMMPEQMYAEPPEVLLAKGVPPEVLLAHGCPPEVLLAHGVPPEMLLALGVPPEMFLQLGFPPEVLLDMGVPLEMLLAMGVPPEMLLEHPPPHRRGPMDGMDPRRPEMIDPDDFAMFAEMRAANALGVGPELLDGFEAYLPREAALSSSTVPLQARPRGPPQQHGPPPPFGRPRQQKQKQEESFSAFAIQERQNQATVKALTRNATMANNINVIKNSIQYDYKPKEEKPTLDAKQLKEAQDKAKAAIEKEKSFLENTVIKGSIRPGAIPSIAPSPLKKEPSPLTTSAPAPKPLGPLRPKPLGPIPQSASLEREVPMKKELAPLSPLKPLGRPKPLGPIRSESAKAEKEDVSAAAKEILSSPLLAREPALLRPKPLGAIPSPIEKDLPMKKALPAPLQLKGEPGLLRPKPLAPIGQSAAKRAEEAAVATAAPPSPPPVMNFPAPLKPLAPLKPIGRESAVPAKLTVADIKESPNDKEESVLPPTQHVLAMPRPLALAPLAPIVKAPAPIAKAPAPIAQAPAPTAKAPAPIARAPAPIARAPAPIAQAPAPFARAPAPIAPIARAPAPIAPAPARFARAPEPIAQAPAPIAPKAPAPIDRMQTPIAAKAAIPEKVKQEAAEKQAAAEAAYFKWNPCEPGYEETDSSDSDSVSMNDEELQQEVMRLAMEKVQRIMMENHAQFDPNMFEAAGSEDESVDDEESVEDEETDSISQYEDEGVDPAEQQAISADATKAEKWKFVIEAMKAEKAAEAAKAGEVAQEKATDGNGADAKPTKVALKDDMKTEIAKEPGLKKTASDIKPALPTAKMEEDKKALLDVPMLSRASHPPDTPTGKGGAGEKEVMKSETKDPARPMTKMEEDMKALLDVPMLARAALPPKCPPRKIQPTGNKPSDKPSSGTLSADDAKKDSDVKPARPMTKMQEDMKALLDVSLLAPTPYIPEAPKKPEDGMEIEASEDDADVEKHSAFANMNLVEDIDESEEESEVGGDYSESVAEEMAEEQIIGALPPEEDEQSDTDLFAKKKNSEINAAMKAMSVEDAKDIIAKDAEPVQKKQGWREWRKNLRQVEAAKEIMKIVKAGGTPPAPEIPNLRFEKEDPGEIKTEDAGKEVMKTDAPENQGLVKKPCFYMKKGEAPLSEDELGSLSELSDISEQYMIRAPKGRKLYSSDEESEEEVLAVNELIEYEESRSEYSVNASEEMAPEEKLMPAEPAMPPADATKADKWKYVIEAMNAQKAIEAAEALQNEEGFEAEEEEIEEEEQKEEEVAELAMPPADATKADKWKYVIESMKAQKAADAAKEEESIEEEEIEEEEQEEPAELAMPPADASKADKWKYVIESMKAQKEAEKAKDEEESIEEEDIEEEEEKEEEVAELAMPPADATKADKWKYVIESMKAQKAAESAKEEAIEEESEEEEVMEVKELMGYKTDSDTDGSEDGPKSMPAEPAMPPADATKAEKWKYVIEAMNAQKAIEAAEALQNEEWNDQESDESERSGGLHFNDVLSIGALSDDEMKAETPSKVAEKEIKAATPSKVAEKEIKAATPSKVAEKEIKSSSPSKVVEKEIKAATPSKVAEKEIKPATPSKVAEKEIKAATPSKVAEKEIKAATPSGATRKEADMSDLLNRNQRDGDCDDMGNSWLESPPASLIEKETQIKQIETTRKIKAATPSKVVEKEIKAATPSKVAEKEIKAATPSKVAEKEIKAATSSKVAEKEIKAATPSKVAEKEIKAATSSKVVEKEIKAATPSKVVEKEIKSATPSKVVEKEVKSATPSEAAKKEIKAATPNIAAKKEIKPVTPSGATRKEADMSDLLNRNQRDGDCDDMGNSWLESPPASLIAKEPQIKQAEATREIKNASMPQKQEVPRTINDAKQKEPENSPSKEMKNALEQEALGAKQNRNIFESKPQASAPKYALDKGDTGIMTTVKELKVESLGNFEKKEDIQIMKAKEASKEVNSASQNKVELARKPVFSFKGETQDITKAKEDIQISKAKEASKEEKNAFENKVELLRKPVFSFKGETQDIAKAPIPKVFDFKPTLSINASMDDMKAPVDVKQNQGDKKFGKMEISPESKPAVFEFGKIQHSQPATIEKEDKKFGATGNIQDSKSASFEKEDKKFGATGNIQYSKPAAFEKQDKPAVVGKGEKSYEEMRISQAPKPLEHEKPRARTPPDLSVASDVSSGSCSREFRQHVLGARRRKEKDLSTSLDCRRTVQALGQDLTASIHSGGDGNLSDASGASMSRSMKSEAMPAGKEPQGKPSRDSIDRAIQKQVDIYMFGAGVTSPEADGTSEEGENKDKKKLMSGDGFNFQLPLSEEQSRRECERIALGANQDPKRYSPRITSAGKLDIQEKNIVPASVLKNNEPAKPEQSSMNIFQASNHHRRDQERREQCETSPDRRKFPGHANSDRGLGFSPERKLKGNERTSKSDSKVIPQARMIPDPSTRREDAYEGEAHNEKPSDGKLIQKSSEGKLSEKSSEGKLREKSSDGKLREKSSEGKLREKSSEGKLREKSSDGKLREKSSEGKLREKSSEGKLREKSSDGKLREKSSEGKLREKSSEGKLREKSSDGKLREKSSEGRLREKSSEGKLREKSSEGKLREKSSDGKLREKSSEGKLREKSSEGKLREKSSDGKLREKSSEGKLREKSSEGKLHEKSSDGKLREKSSKGKLREKSSEGKLREKSSEGKLREKSSEGRGQDESCDKPWETQIMDVDTDDDESVIEESFREENYHSGFVPTYKAEYKKTFADTYDSAYKEAYNAAYKVHNKLAEKNLKKTSSDARNASYNESKVQRLRAIKNDAKTAYLTAREEYRSVYKKAKDEFARNEASKYAEEVYESKYNAAQEEYTRVHEESKEMYAKAEASKRTQEEYAKIYKAARIEYAQVYKEENAKYAKRTADKKIKDKYARLYEYAKEEYDQNKFLNKSKDECAAAFNEAKEIYAKKAADEELKIEYANVYREAREKYDRQFAAEVAKEECAKKAREDALEHARESAYKDASQSAYRYALGSVNPDEQCDMETEHWARKTQYRMSGKEEPVKQSQSGRGDQEIRYMRKMYDAIVLLAGKYEEVGTTVDNHLKTKGARSNMDDRYATNGDRRPNFSESDSRPRYATESDNKPRYATESDNKPRYATESDSRPRYATESDNKPRYATESDNRPNYAENSEPRPQWRSQEQYSDGRNCRSKCWESEEGMRRECTCMHINFRVEIPINITVPQTETKHSHSCPRANVGVIPKRRKRRDLSHVVHLDD